jgi:hypothetical protein
VEVAILEFAQVGKRGRLLFWFAKFFCVCLGVVDAFFCTYLHGFMLKWHGVDVEACMDWFFLHKNSVKAMISAMRLGN